MADEIGLTKSFIMTTTTEYKSKEIHSTEPLISLESVIPYINFYSLDGKLIKKEQLSPDTVYMVR